MAGRNPKYNASGCADPTAFEALEKKVHNLVNTVKFIVDWAGFEMLKLYENIHQIEPPSD
ncbi:hypothetical protein [Streptococcus parasuis]|uniref:hypothetical protein n=1 Tax=Streptococcus parasuis TaxID=1501662 RepID=UPI00370D600D